MPQIAARSGGGPIERTRVPGTAGQGRSTSKSSPRPRLDRAPLGAARLQRLRRDVLKLRRGPLEARHQGRRIDGDAEVHLRLERDALGRHEGGHRAHVRVHAHAQLRDRRRPARELQGREQALERIELHVEVERPAPRRPLAERIADLEQVLAHPRVPDRPLLGSGGRGPRRDDGADQIARRVAELRLLGGADLFFLDEACEQLAFETGSRDRAVRRRTVGEGTAELHDPLRSLVQRVRSCPEREEVE